jgi:HK97 family phage major capsid protein
MQDAKYNIEQETIALGTAKMMRVANLAFVAGNGASKPKGFTVDLPTGVDNRVLSNSTTAFDADDLIRLCDFGLKSDYARVGKFAMNRKTKGYTREFKAGDDNYLWTPGIAGNVPATLLGKEYVEFDDMDAPTYSGGNLVFADGDVPVIFADWNKFYGVARKSGIYMLRDPYTKKHSVLFYMSMRVGGARLLDEAGSYLVTATS